MGAGRVGTWKPGNRERAGDVERFYQVQHGAFEARNFGPRALANDIQALRFDLEVVRKFHPDLLDPAWYRAGKDLSRRLAIGTTDGLRRILDHVRSTESTEGDRALQREIAAGLRAQERVVRREMELLALTLQRAVGTGTPLTVVGDRVSTPFQSGLPSLEQAP